jgi:predicted enzyme related to lactoylglutathione lyase
MMKRIVCAAMIGALVAGSAYAQETRLRSTRVSAPDVVKTAAFYETVFGLKEVRKEDRDGKPFEKILNYAQDSANNPSGAPNVVIILRAPDAPAPSVSNLVFGVKDVDKVVAKATAAGGAQSRKTNVSATSGAKIGFIKDPAGNEIELIQEKAK